MNKVATDDLQIKKGTQILKEVSRLTSKLIEKIILTGILEFSSPRSGYKLSKDTGSSKKPDSGFVKKKLFLKSPRSGTASGGNFKQFSSSSGKEGLEDSDEIVVTKFTTTGLSQAGVARYTTETISSISSQHTQEIQSPVEMSMPAGLLQKPLMSQNFSIGVEGAGGYSEVVEYQFEESRTEYDQQIDENVVDAGYYEGSGGFGAQDPAYGNFKKSTNTFQKIEVRGAEGGLGGGGVGGGRMGSGYRKGSAGSYSSRGNARQSSKAGQRRSNSRGKGRSSGGRGYGPKLSVIEENAIEGVSPLLAHNTNKNNTRNTNFKTSLNQQNPQQKSNNNSREANRNTRTSNGYPQPNQSSQPHQVSLRLKGRILQSILSSTNPATHKRRIFYRWWAITHPETISLSVKKIVTTARMAPSIALYRFMYLLDKIRFEKRREFTRERIRKFVRIMELVTNPIPVRNKALAFRKMMKPALGTGILTRLELAMRAKVLESFRKMVREMLLSRTRDHQRELDGLISSSIQILAQKSKNQISEVLRPDPRFEKAELIARHLLNGTRGKGATGLHRVAQNRLSQNYLRKRRLASARLIRSLLQSWMERELSNGLNSIQKRSNFNKYDFENDRILKGGKLSDLSKAQKAKLKEALNQLRNHSRSIFNSLANNEQNQLFDQKLKNQLKNSAARLLARLLNNHLKHLKRHGLQNLRIFNQNKFFQKKLAGIHINNLTRGFNRRLAQSKQLCYKTMLLESRKMEIIEIRLSKLFGDLEASQKAKSTQAYNLLKNHTIQTVFDMETARFALEKILSKINKKGRAALKHLQEHNKKAKHVVGTYVRLASKTQRNRKIECYQKMVNFAEKRALREEAFNSIARALSNAQLNLLRNAFQGIKDWSFEREIFVLKTEISDQKKDHLIRSFTQSLSKTLSKGYNRLTKSSSSAKIRESKIWKMIKIIESKLLSSKHRAVTRVYGRSLTTSGAQVFIRALENLKLSRFRNGFDAILYKAEFLRLRRIKTGLYLIERMWNRNYIQARGYVKKYLFNAYHLKMRNPWFEKSVTQLAVNGALNYQTCFWKIRFWNKRLNAENRRKGQLRLLKFLRSLGKVVEAKRLREVSLAFYKVGITAGGVVVINNAQGDDNQGYNPNQSKTLILSTYGGPGGAGASGRGATNWKQHPGDSFSGSKVISPIYNRKERYDAESEGGDYFMDVRGEFNAGAARQNVSNSRGFGQKRSSSRTAVRMLSRDGRGLRQSRTRNVGAGFGAEVENGQSSMVSVRSDFLARGGGGGGSGYQGAELAVGFASSSKNKGYLRSGGVVRKGGQGAGKKFVKK